MNNFVKGNKPLRIFAAIMLLLLLVSHFMGQVDLTQLSFLWLMIAMALNALQATYTGFCPMLKNNKGECAACGVPCEMPSATSSNTVQTSQSSCCENNSSCCPDQSAAPAKSDCCAGQNGCGNEPKQDCCNATEAPLGCCADAPTTTDCTKDTATNGCGCQEARNENQKEILVLGTGCAKCKSTYTLFSQVMSEMTTEAKLIKVEDVAVIASYGVMSTPAVVIAGQVVHAGSVPTRAQIVQWLQQI